MSGVLDGRTLVVGLSGGIACYKACEVVRVLVQRGARVRVVMTRAACEFVTPLTLQTLSGHPVATDTFSLTQESEIGHIRLADTADALVIAPATANVLAKLAHGIADDLLTTIALATKAPLVLAPAMNVNMWQHPATQENVATLATRGARIVGPGTGQLACGWEGAGRLTEPGAIADAIETLFVPQDLRDERVLVSAGPTREPIDPVRYLSNHSSGKMGYAIARAAARRGAQVTLVTGPTALPPPAGVRVVAVSSAADMTAALATEFTAASVLVMAAAVADYRARRPASEKIKKGTRLRTLELEKTTDILTSLAARKGPRVVVGFAAETRDLQAEARRKLRAKGADLIVGNDVTAPGAGFGSDTNLVSLFAADGAEETLPLLPKDEVADRILDWVVARCRASASGRRRPAVARRRLGRR